MSRNTAQTSKIVLALDAWDIRLINALEFYRYLTAEQVCYLYYSPTSLTHVKARLKMLTDKGYIQPVCKSNGKMILPIVYTLDGLGVKYLKHQGIDLGRYFRPHKEAVRDESELWHTSTINDFLGAIEVLARKDEKVTIVERYTDVAMNANPCTFPVAVKDASGRIVERLFHAVPDFWLHCSLAMGGGSTRRVNVWGEIDMGKQSEKVIRGKVRNFLAIVKSKALRERFQAKSATFAFATPKGEARVSFLRQCIRDELLKTPKEAAAASRIFLVTALEKPIDPNVLAYENVWLHPFDDNKRVSLFDLRP